MTKKPDTVEWELLSRFYEGGDAADDALDQLRATYLSQLHRFAMSKLGNVQDAEEVVNDTMTRLWASRTAHRLEHRPGVKFSTLLYEICKNLCLDLLRKKSKRLPEGSDPSGVETIHSPHRSEEHTSELQSPCTLVCRLLLE